MKGLFLDDDGVLRLVPRSRRARAARRGGALGGELRSQELDTVAVDRTGAVTAGLPVATTVFRQALPGGTVRHGRGPDRQ